MALPVHLSEHLVIPEWYFVVSISDSGVLSLTQAAPWSLNTENNWQPLQLSAFLTGHSLLPVLFWKKKSVSSYWCKFLMLKLSKISDVFCCIERWVPDPLCQSRLVVYLNPGHSFLSFSATTARQTLELIYLPPNALTTLLPGILYIDPNYCWVNFFTEDRERTMLSMLVNIISSIFQLECH